METVDYWAVPRESGRWQIWYAQRNGMIYRQRPLWGMGTVSAEVALLYLTTMKEVQERDT